MYLKMEQMSNLFRIPYLAAFKFIKAASPRDVFEFLLWSNRRL